MYWEFLVVSVALTAYLVAFTIRRWGKDRKTPEEQSRWNFIHPGSGGA